ncbi:sugar ABC transporter ATP-binding protein [Oceanibacterium hippocampi]|uniref:sugar ABC transporter ATP-binding protein n=1 Tax=Oceanibacterium hippocampi TaxID=745714 RepID=UPI001592B66E|nr:sugar ABC transporter ATP-binding protein [Oceanibacterium hippocampi]
MDLTADAGEVHALVGANGAGKSTLMNLLSGAQSPSGGEIRIAGQSMQFAGPSAAQEQGIATVYQEFSLVPQLSVSRNIYLGREPKGALGLIDGRALRTQTIALLERFGLKLDPDAEVSTLSVAEQQLVEIARALSFEGRILILDEPTAVLSLAEQENLFAIIRQLRRDGMLILYVSHYLKEVLAIADQVTVLRDGEKIATRLTKGLTVDALVETMTGASGAFDKAAAPRTMRDEPPYLVSYQADTGTSTLTLAAGEIVGVAGLVGSGRTTFAKALTGNPLPTAIADIRRAGESFRFASPRAAMREGFVYITEDRKRDGIFTELDIVANATASALNRLGRGPLRDVRREKAAASDMLTRLRLVASSLGAPIGKLSGGNQQKVLIGRALLTEPRVLVCDEPTRGIDVGAKAEIHEILRDLAASGVAILVVSSETEELLALAHRIVVMHERCFVAEMPVEEADDMRILLAASGGAEVMEKNNGN